METTIMRDIGLLAKGKVGGSENEGYLRGIPPPMISLAITGTSMVMSPLS